MLKVDIDTQVPLPSLLAGTQLVDWAQLAYVDAENKASTNAEVAIAVVDEQAMRDFLEASLTSRFAVRTTSGGAAAIEILEGEEFDLVLSDVRMPGGDGLTVTPGK